MPNPLTQNDILALSQKLADGDRGGFYWDYYKLTGEYQSLIQGQITTYSGTWGGMAMTGNYLAKLSDQEHYKLTLDQFSTDIIAGTLRALNASGTGILSKLDMQLADWDTWDKKQMADLFPGNMQFAMSLDGWLFHRDKIFADGISPNGGVNNSRWMGIQNIDLFSSEDYKPEELGLRFDDFDDVNYEKIDLSGHIDSDDRFLRVIERSTGHLVFIQDTKPPQPFGDYISVGILGTVFGGVIPGVGITWGPEDYRYSLDPSSSAYQARALMQAYVQANPIPDADFNFIPNQVPPNVFFDNELNNGISIETPELWHQEILNRIQPLNSDDTKLDVLARDGLIQLYSSDGEEKGIEPFLQSMESLFLGVSHPTPILTEVDYAARSQAVMNHLDSLLGGSASPFLIEVLSDKSVSELVDLAKNGIEFRYALINLLPFAVSGDPAIYAIHNQNSELAIENFSDQYIEDRSEMLSLMLRANQGNIDHDTPVKADFTDEFIIYEDLVLDDSVRTYSQELTLHLRGFGTNGDDVDLLGDVGNDHIYGMDGNDTIHGCAGRDHLEGNADNDTLFGDAGIDHLYGGKGNDHLTGGTGNDELYGGEGDDTYYYKPGDGDDTIRDSSGNNHLVIDDNVIEKITPKDSSGRLFKDDYDNTYVLLDSDEMSITVSNGALSGKITIEGFSQSTNNFGLTVEAPVASEPPDGIYTVGTGSIDEDGTSKDIRNTWDGRNGHTYQGFINDVGVSVDTSQITSLWDYATAIDKHGQPLKSATNADGEVSYEFKFEGTDQQDVLNGGYHGDLLIGRDGDDQINGNGGFDILQGGSGADVIHGGDGSDLIWGYVPNKYDEDDIPLTDYVGEALNGNDELFGEAGNDLVSGDDGDDLIVGGQGEDKLYGGEGSDTIIGGTENDVVFGDSRTEMSYEGSVLVQTPDLIQSKADGAVYDDTITGGAGEDYLYGELGHDTIDGGADNDFIFGDRFAIGGEVENDLDGNLHGNDSLTGGSGDDLIVGGGGNDNVRGGIGNDIIAGDEDLFAGNASIRLGGQYHGNDTIDAGDGADVVHGGGGDDTIQGGDGDDQLWGDSSYVLAPAVELGVTINRPTTARLDESWHGNDEIRGGAGKDTIVGGGGDDRLFGDSENDTLYGNSGNDQLSGGTGNDWLLGDEGDDTLDGGEGHDTLIGGAGEDYLVGNIGNDRLLGGDGNDSLTGDVGDDYLAGGAGNDTYILGSGDGRDTIEDVQGENNITFSDMTDIANLTIVQDSENTTLYYAGASNYVFLSNASFGASKINLAPGQAASKLTFTATSASTSGSGGDDIMLGNGYGAAQVLNGFGGSDYLVGGFGSDSLYGGDGDDVLDGNKSSNTLYGGAGNDTYILGGDNNSLIYGAESALENDIIEIKDDITHYDVSLVQAGDDLQIHILGISGFSTVVNYFGGGAVAIKEIVFKADGTRWSKSDIAAKIKPLELGINGTDGVDNLEGTDAADKLYGKGGDDTLTGGAGNDLLDGGLGADTLIGGAGKDTYYVDNVGDVIIESGSTNYSLRDIAYINVDKYVLPDTANIDLIYLRDSAIEFTGNATSTNMKQKVWGNGHDNVIVHGDQYNWSDGEGGNDTIYGNRKMDSINGGDGNDLIYGEGGYDDLYGDAGDDRLYGGEGGGYLDGGGGDDYLEAGENYAESTLDGGSGNDTLVSGTGSDVLNGGAGDDTIIVNAGVAGTTDYINIDEGNDVYIFGLNSNAIIQSRTDNADIDELRLSADFTPEKIQIVKEEDRLLINSGGNSIIVNGFFTSDSTFEGIYLNSNEEFWDRYRIDEVLAGSSNINVIEGSTNDDVLSGGMGVDEIYGFEGGDSLTGNDGDDVLVGGLGDDDLYGGLGSDTYIYNLGDGDDLISEGKWGIDKEAASNDVLVLGEGIAKDSVTFTRTSRDLTIHFDTGEYILNSHAWDGANEDGLIDEIRFSNGDILTKDDLYQIFSQADDTPNELYGRDTSDHFVAKGGNDALYGFGGDDILDGGEGNDYIVDAAGNDVFIGGPGDDRIYDYGGFDTYYYNLGDGDDTIYETINDGGVLIFGEGIARESLVLKRGSQSLTVEFIDPLGKVLFYQFFTDERNKLQFSDGSEITVEELREMSHTGTDNSEEVYGDSTDDLLQGFGGNDTIYGYDGDDTLIGGTGNDSLNGGAGNNIYKYAFGDGTDKIDLASGSDELWFSPEITPDIVHISREDQYGYMRISFANTAEKITVSASSVVDKGDVWMPLVLRFDNGDVWGSDELLRQSLIGTPADDNLKGSILDDALIGHAGNDNLLGFGGNDQLSGGRGKDTLEGGAGADAYLFSAGDGDDTITEAFSTDNNVIRFDASVQREDVKLYRYEKDGKDYLLIAYNNEQDFITTEWDYAESASVLPIQSVEFTDGHSWTSPYISEAAELISSEILVDTNMHVAVLNSLASTTLDSFTFDAHTLFGNERDNELIGTSPLKPVTHSGTWGEFRNPQEKNVIYGGKGNDVYHLDIADSDYRFDNAVEFFDQGEDTVVLYGSRNGGYAIPIYIENLLSKPDNQRPAKYFPNDATYRSYDVDGNNHDNKISPIGFGASSTIDGRGGDDVIEMIGGKADGPGIYSHASKIVGGTGNDQLFGSSGDEDYEFYRNDGHDIISDTGGYDRIVIHDVDIDEVVAWKDGLSLEIAVQGSNLAITVLDWVHLPIDEFYFSASGTSYNAADFVAQFVGERPANSRPEVQGDIADFQVHRGEAINIDVVTGFFNDPDGDAVTYTLSSADHLSLPTWLNFDGRYLSGDSNSAMHGSGPVSTDFRASGLVITASDGEFSSSVSFMMELTKSSSDNIAPVATNKPQVWVAENKIGYYKIPDLLAYDVEGDAIQYTLVPNDWSTQAGDTIIIDPSLKGYKEGLTRTLSLVASDGQDSTNIDVTVRITAATDINNLPIATGATNEFEFEAKETNTLSMTSFFVDPDRDDLTYSYSLNGESLPNWITVDGENVTFKPTEDNRGTYSLAVIASDGVGQAESTISLTIGDASGNVKPVANYTAAISVESNSETLYTIPSDMFTDDDGDALTYSVEMITATEQKWWFSFDGESLSLSPKNSWHFPAGVYEFKITASDGAKTASTTLAVDVTEEYKLHTPYTTGDLADITLNAGETVYYEIPASFFIDPDGDALNYSFTDEGQPLPDWITADENGLLIAPASDFEGFNGYQIIVTASDGQYQVENDFFLYVLTPNRAPYLNGSLEDKTVNEGDSLEIEIPHFQDRDGDWLTYSFSLNDEPLPGWITVDGLSLVATPGADNAGTYQIKVTADDGELQTSAEFSLTVASNNTAPEVDTPLAEQVLQEDLLWSFAIPANAFKDADGDALTYSIDGGSLPSWLDFDGTVFSGTPTNDDVGEYVIGVSATDGEEQVTAYFALFVANVNDAPIVNIALLDQTIDEDAAWSYALPADAFSDIDGDVLTYSVAAEDLPGWLNFDGYAFSGTPQNEDVGHYAITVTASDGLAQVSSDFVLTVTNVNDAPIVDIALADQNISEDSFWHYALPTDVFSDADGDTLAITAKLADGSALPSWLLFDGLAFSGTPSQSDTGSLDISVTATDGELEVSEAFSLVIEVVNDAPVATNDVLSVTQNNAIVVNVAELTANDTDEEGDTLSISSVSSASNGSVVLDEATGTITFTPTSGFFGEAEFEYLLTDGDLTSSGVVTINVEKESVNNGTIAMNAPSSQSGFVLSADARASDGSYFSAVQGDGALVYDFSVDKAGDYQLLTSVLASSAASNSLRYQVDSNPVQHWSLPLDNNWQWAGLSGVDVTDVAISAPTAYAQQDIKGTINLLDGGNGIEMEGNRWQKIDFDYEIKSSTVLSFDFTATREGEIHGIGFDTDNVYNTNLTFQLFGTQNWGIRDFDYTGSGTQHFEIRVGDYYQGNFSNMFFIMDDDAKANGAQVFQNIEIYEERMVQDEFIIVESALYGFGGQDGAGTVTVDADQALVMIGNRWQAQDFDYRITENTILSFDFSATKQGEIHGIALETDNAISTNRTFQLFGTQNWGNRDFDYSGSGTQHFEISVSQYFSGDISKIAFIMDDDAKSAGEQVFSNVRLYEQGVAEPDIDPMWLEAGDHTLTIYGAEPGVGVDQVLITDDMSLAPVGIVGVNTFI